MDQLLELALWALIVAVGWLLGGARDSRRTRRPAPEKPPAPTPGPGSGRPGPAPARKVLRRKPAAVASVRRPEAPAGAVPASTAPEEGAEGVTLKGVPGDQEAVGTPGPSVDARVVASAGFGPVPAWQRRPAPSLQLVPPGAEELVRAVVMAEVMGPPRALRPYRVPGSARWRGR